MSEQERRSEYPVIMTRLNEVDKKMDRVLLVLEGNGNPGILRTVDRHDQWIAAREDIEMTVDRHDQWIGARRSIEKIVLGAVITLFVSGVAAAALYLAKVI